VTAATFAAKDNVSRGDILLSIELLVGTAVLAQANASPQAVLGLLK